LIACVCGTLVIAHCKNIYDPTSGSCGTPRGDGGDDRPHRLIAAEKGKVKKVLAKKRKASNHEAEVARAVAAAVDAAEVGGCSGSHQIGSELTTTQRHVVLHAEQLHGSPPYTIMLGGR